MLSPKQKEWLWQDHKKAKANGEDIPMAKKRHRQPSNKLTFCLESAVAAQKWQICSLTAQNKRMIAALIASGIDIPKSNPSLENDNDKGRKMTANKKNSNLAVINKTRK